MGFFQDLRADLSHAVTDFGSNDGMKGREAVVEKKPSGYEAVKNEPVISEPVMREMEEVKPEVSVVEEVQPEEVQVEEVKEEIRERKIDMNAIFNQPYSDEVSNITMGMVINGDITSQGSLDLTGAVHGNINISGKMSIMGVIEGNSQAAEIYAESAKITGEVRSLGVVKIGQETVVIGNIYATSAVIAGAVKGDIDVHGPVVLDSTAIVMGNIKAKSVQINNGAVIEGMCSLSYADVNPSSFFEEIKKAGRKK